MPSAATPNEPMPSKDDRSWPFAQFVTADEFARLAGISRRTIDRYRKVRPPGFPTEHDIGAGNSVRPRFKLSDVQAWLESRALW